MEEPLYKTIGPQVPAIACGLCLKYPLMLLEDGHTVICQYCDSPGNPMPPVGGFPDDETDGSPDEDEYEEFDLGFTPDEEGQ